MNYVSLRYSTNQRYGWAAPLCGRSGRHHDYPVWTRTSVLIQREVSAFLRVNPLWRRSGQVYSHVTIAWSAGALQVTVFFLNYSRRRYRLFRLQRRRRRFLSVAQLCLARSLRRSPKRSARAELARLTVSAPPPRRRRRRRFSIRKINRRRRRSRRHLRRVRLSLGQPSLLVGWLERFRFRRFGHFIGAAALPPPGGFQLRRWLALAWRSYYRRHLRRVTSLRLWTYQKQLSYGVPLQWRWKRVRKPCSVNTVLALVAYRLRGRFTRRVKLMARPLMQVARRVSGVRGVYLRCAGRFTRQQRADHKVFRWGRLGRSDFGQPLQQGRWVVPLKFGTVSLTVTMSLTAYARRRPRRRSR